MKGVAGSRVILNMSTLNMRRVIALPYHLNSMPTVYLVDADGRVISADRHLDLESLLGGNQ